MKIRTLKLEHESEDKSSTSTKIKLKFGEVLEKNYKTHVISFKPNKNIESHVRKFNPHFSELNSTNIYRYVLTKLEVNPVDSIISIFGIKHKEHQTVYAFLYGYPHSDTERVEFPSITYDNMRFLYVCISPSFISSDGEYRGHVLKANVFFKTVMEKNKQIWNLIEEHIREKINRLRWGIYNEQFFPSSDIRKKADNFQFGIISKYKLDIALLMGVWFINMYKKYNNLTEIHVNKKYIDIFFNDYKTDKKFYEKLIERFGGQKIMDIYKSFSGIGTRVVDDIKDQLYFKIGQKMTPLTLSEAENPFSINNNNWKEFLIMQKMNLLAVNGISNGFPVQLFWCYVKNSHKGLFDSEKQYEKLERSDIAKHITRILIQARMNTYDTIEEYKGQKISGKETTESIDNDFSELHKLIERPVQHSKKRLILSNVVLTTFSSYVGRTFMDSLFMCKKNKTYAKNIGDPFSKNYTIFYKYLFEMCYNLLCLNKYFKLIHGDLHLNNATLKKKFFTTSKADKFNSLKNPVKLFAISEKYQFVFPESLYNASIIDYSRSIINPTHIDFFRDPILHKKFSLITDEDDFTEHQKYNLLNLYLYALPDMSNKKNKIQLLINTKFDACFRIMTLLDIYNFCTKLRMLFEFKKEIPPIHVKCKKIVQDVIVFSEKFMVSEMNKLIDDESYSDTVLSAEYPLVILMRNIFPGYLAQDNPNMTLVDISVLHDKIKYNINDIKDYPPVYMIHVEKSWDKSFGNLIKVLNTYSRKTFNIKRRTLVKGLDTVELIAQRHAEKVIV